MAELEIAGGFDWSRRDWREIPMHEALVVWRQHHKLNPRTMRGYLRSVKQFMAITKVRAVEEVTAQAICRFQDVRVAQGKFVSTVNGDTCGILAFMKFVARRTSMPAEVIRSVSGLLVKERPREEPPDYHSQDEFGRLKLIAWRIAPWFGLAFELACWIGTRRTELRHLHREDFDLERRVLRLTRATKFGKHRNVSLCQPAVDLIRKHAPGSGPIFPSRNRAAKSPYVCDDTFRQVMSQLKKISGVRCHWHKCRRTFTTWALRNEVPVEIVARELGHSSLEMVYAKYHSWIRGYNDKIERITKPLPDDAA